MSISMIIPKGSKHSHRFISRWIWLGNVIGLADFGTKTLVMKILRLVIKIHDIHIVHSNSKERAL